MRRCQNELWTHSKSQTSFRKVAVKTMSSANHSTDEHDFLALRMLLESGLLSVAMQPKNNKLDLPDRKLERLFVFLIDHDYPGGSAAMHNAVFNNYDLPYRSCFMIGDPANVMNIFAALSALQIYHGGGAGSGFKDKIGPALTKLDISAATIGSVNVVARENGAFVGYNTDGAGFVAGLLNEYPGAITGQKVVILGAGGTALPIAYELAQRQPKEMIVINRTVSKAERIVHLISPSVAARAAGEDAIGAEISDAGLVVNTSNKGAQPNEKFSAFAPMTGNVDADLAVSLANIQRLPKDAIVADILLEERPLTLALAAECGRRIHNGRSMNLFQAVPAFKILTGLDKPDHEILALMRGAL
jgi:shikimate dehydrogenase